MDTQLSHRPIPEIQFRVLMIGRVNAGKTSILQSVCDTTESPVIYRGYEEVCMWSNLFICDAVFTVDYIKLVPSTDVSNQGLVKFLSGNKDVSYV